MTILKVGPPYCEVRLYGETATNCNQPTVAICKNEACGLAICDEHAAKCAICKGVICDTDICAQSHECLPVERAAAA